MTDLCQKQIKCIFHGHLNFSNYFLDFQPKSQYRDGSKINLTIFNNLTLTYNRKKYLFTILIQVIIYII